jgi:nitrite reductase/ring-hydroxylating ferredoxin subunit
MNGAAWRDFPGAPQPGTRVCTADDLPETGAISRDIAGFPILLVATPDGLRAYVNACPHQYLPLDWRSGDIVSADGAMLRCSNHDAGFDAATGQGVDGWGQGCALDPVPVHIAQGWLVIG